jgi:hypothetical protein
MPLTQIEFTVLCAVIFGFLIFTPERLVLLRGFVFWGALTLAAWHGHDFWRRNPWAERVATALTTGRGLHEIANVAMDHLLSDWVDQVRQRCTGWVKALFGWARLGNGDPALIPSCDDDGF